jgi:lysophospholipid acyltransferase (LPLAT)-like uncharacterized protein
MTVADQSKFTFLQRIVLAVVPRMVWALFSVWGRTWRFEVIAEEGVTSVAAGVESPSEIFCFWHQCVLPSMVYFRSSRSVIIVSQSFDGELITRTLKMFGYDAVRGSSTRGAHEGLMGLKHVLDTGRTAIFTADGPRGPIYQTKMGPIKLAQMTGAPIGVFHLEPEHAWAMRSWDHFLIPKPFTRICVSWVKGITVSSKLAAEEFEPMRQELTAAIERARLRARDYFKKARE